MIIFNYKSNNNYYCFDGIDPNVHIHKFITYRVKNSNQHYCYCSCGFSKVELHSFRLVPTDDYCEKCLFSKPGGSIIFNTETKEDYENEKNS